MAVLQDNISILIIKLLKNEATESDKRQLEEWASLSVENRNTLNRFHDYDWVLEQARIFKQIDHEKNRREFHRRIAEGQIRKAGSNKAGRFIRELAIAIWQQNAILFGKKPRVIGALAIVCIICYLNFLIPQAPNEFKPKPGPAGTAAVGYGKNDKGKLLASITPNKNKTQKDNIIKVPLGVIAEKRPLPDGSTYWLNANSTIKYSSEFSKSDRQVWITGEAYFDVTGKNKKPFCVRINTIRIETFKGRLNVTGYEEDSLRVTAVDGELDVISVSGRIHIASGQSALIMKNGDLIFPKEETTDRATDWVQGKFVFHQERLLSVVRELGRYYELNIDQEHWRDILIDFEGHRYDTPQQVLEGINATDKRVHLKLSGTTLFDDSSGTYDIKSISH